MDAIRIDNEKAPIINVSHAFFMQFLLLVSVVILEQIPNVLWRVAVDLIIALTSVVIESSFGQHIGLYLDRVIDNDIYGSNAIVGWTAAKNHQFFPAVFPENFGLERNPNVFRLEIRFGYPYDFGQVRKILEPLKRVISELLQKRIVINVLAVKILRVCTA